MNFEMFLSKISFQKKKISQHISYIPKILFQK